MATSAGLEALKKTGLVLQGDHVRLEPLTLAHAEQIFAVAQDEAVWQWLPEKAPTSLGEMQDWIEEALSGHSRGGGLPFAVIHLATGNAIGSTSYGNISVRDRGIEIGWTWYGRVYWRTVVNTECKYLLLRHAFEKLGCIRVQFRTDLRNERSQRAIERIGAVLEGTLRKNRIVKDGYQRSTVFYSIIDDEWPAVKARLEAMLRR